MAAFIKRTFRDTADMQDALFVLEMDTFGGRVDAALRIVDTILDDAPGKTVAFVTNKAISAGALIALACDELVMRPNTTIGDCAPISFSSEGPQMLGEKFQSPLRAKFRALARRNGYPLSLAEAMVTADMEVYEVIKDGERIFMESREFDNLPEAEKKKIRSKKIVVAKGELLTMDDVEAHDLGFSRMSADSIEAMLVRMNLASHNIVRMEQNWSESLGRFIGSIAPILMMIGLAALYTELKAPGFGVPGIIGILCLGLVFLNQYLVGLADYTELLFIVLGIALLALEVFVIPGFGLAGITGFVCIATGMILAFQDFVIPAPEMPWQKELLIRNSIQVLGSCIAAIIGSLLFLRYLIPRLGTVVEGPYLQSSLSESHADSDETKGVRVGDKGRTLTPLRPAGKMELGLDIIDVVSEGEFIARDTPVKIADIRGNRVIVRRIVE